MKRKNVIKNFLERAASLGEATCAYYKIGSTWQTISWNDMALRVRALALTLKRTGIKPAGRVAIVAKTSIEWTIADLAILTARAVTVPIYPTLTVDRVSQILSDAGPSLIFVENDELERRVTDAMEMCGMEIPVRRLNSVWQNVGTEDFVAVDELILAIDPLDDATIVYTSGTTGEQKGVVLTHKNLLAEVDGVEDVFDFTSDEIGLLCLPLAHVLGRMMQFYELLHGCRLAYVESVEKLAANYIELRPHFVCAVPRMLEKIFEATKDYIRRANPVLKLLFKWSIGVGLAYESRLRKYRRISFWLKVKYFIVYHLVFRKIRAGLGGRVRTFICGGAPLNEEICKFLHAIGILVLEGYGLTETFAAVTVNKPDDYHFGTVGKPIPGVDIKFAHDGEVLIKGPIVFREYRNRPEDTKNAFTEDGWFKSGDIGEYSRDGFLRITGRKKDMIITAGGKNIAPQMIEARLSSSPFVNQVMVCGDGRRYLTALITLNKDAVLSYLKKQGVREIDVERFSRNKVVYELIKRHIDEQNSKLAQYETIKKFAIIDGAFSVESGELTPTLKLRRTFTGKKYEHILDELYKS